MSAIFPPALKFRAHHCAKPWRSLIRKNFVKVVARRGIFIVRKTKVEILDMITTWAALESMSARLAAEHANPDDIKELHQLTDPYSDVDRHTGYIPTPTSASVIRPLFARVAIV